MRVVFLEDVAGVAQGGDVKEVKNGFARNYLIPKNLAVAATHNALQQISSIAQRAEGDRTRTLTDMKALGETLEGTQINIEMRSGVNNRLYGSVTNAVVADELASITGREIDRRTVILAEPIRQLGLYEVILRLHQDVEVPIGVLVYPIGADPEAALAAARGEEAAEETSEESAEVDSEQQEASDEAAEDAASEESAEELVDSLEDKDDEEAADESEDDDSDESEAAEEEESAEESADSDEDEADVEETEKDSQEEES